MTEPTTQSAAVELKACPFCGEPMRLSVDDIDGWIASVACDGCDMRGPMSEWKYADVENAKADGLNRWLAAWNTRAPSAPAAGAVEAAVAAERERCAKVADEHAETWGLAHASPALVIAAAIRGTDAKGEPSA